MLTPLIAPILFPLAVTLEGLTHAPRHCPQWLAPHPIIEGLVLLSINILSTELPYAAELTHNLFLEHHLLEGSKCPPIHHPSVSALAPDRSQARSLAKGPGLRGQRTWVWGIHVEVSICCRYISLIARRLLWTHNSLARRIYYIAGGVNSPSAART